MRNILPEKWCGFGDEAEVGEGEKEEVECEGEVLKRWGDCGSSG